MKVHETRSHARASGEEEKVMTRKQKAESKEHEAEQSPKKPKSENENGQPNGKDAAEIAAEFEEFCKAIKEHLSINKCVKYWKLMAKTPPALIVLLSLNGYSLTPT
uniref:Uncharacterized protein n=1 Tax=Quercus lobata TaxID=97700 RepID=A0A7N2QX97_QUELO